MSLTNPTYGEIKPKKKTKFIIKKKLKETEPKKKKIKFVHKKKKVMKNPTYQEVEPDRPSTPEGIQTFQPKEQTHIEAPSGFLEDPDDIDDEEYDELVEYHRRGKTFASDEDIETFLEEQNLTDYLNYFQDKIGIEGQMISKDKSGKYYKDKDLLRMTPMKDATIRGILDLYDKKVGFSL